MHGVIIPSCACGSTPCVRYAIRRLFFLLFLVCTWRTSFAYADDGLTTFVKYLFNGLSDVYATIKKISAGIAAVVIASSFIAIVTTGSKEVFEKIRKIVLYACIALIFIWLAPVISKAARAPLTDYAIIFNASGYDEFSKVPHLAEAIQSIWNAAEYIVLALCAIGIVYGAWMFFSINILGRISTERQIEQGKASIKYAIIALIAFYLLPIIFKSGYFAFHAWGWNPPTSIAPTE